MMSEYSVKKEKQWEYATGETNPVQGGTWQLDLLGEETFHLGPVLEMGELHTRPEGRLVWQEHREQF